MYGQPCSLPPKVSPRLTRYSVLQKYSVIIQYDTFIPCYLPPGDKFAVGNLITVLVCGGYQVCVTSSRCSKLHGLVRITRLISFSAHSLCVHLLFCFVFGMMSHAGDTSASPQPCCPWKPVSEVHHCLSCSFYLSFFLSLPHSCSSLVLLPQTFPYVLTMTAAPFRCLLTPRGNSQVTHFSDTELTRLAGPVLSSIYPHTPSLSLCSCLLAASLL